MQEIWKDVVGYEGLYKVSNYGNVKSMKFRKKSKSKNLKQTENKYGYLCVNLYKNKKPKQLRVNRIVAIAFIDNQYEKLFVNHIDFNRKNNNVENLEWVTQQENNLHSMDNIVSASKKINSKKVSRINPETFEIEKIYENGKEVTKDGFNRVAVSYVCNGKRKTHKGYFWKFI